MIPPFDSPFGYLPASIHGAKWQEVVTRFTFNERRRELTQGLLQALQNLAGAGCRRIILDGSFVTSKELPNDYDGAWDPAGVDGRLLDPVLLDLQPPRLAMKAKYRGELFPETCFADGRRTFRDFFQFDRNGLAKGVVEIDLGSLP